MAKILITNYNFLDKENYELLNQDYGFEFINIKEGTSILDETNYQSEIDVVIYSSSTTHIAEEYFAMLERNRIHYLVAKMTGIAQIDLQAAKRHNVKVANVRNYSPNAIAELALSLTLSMNRELFRVKENEKKQDFTKNAIPCGKEIREQTIGIIGVGQIGIKTAAYFKGLEAEVIGYDPYPKKEAEVFLHYVSLEELRKRADIVILHTPYIEGVNYHLIDAEFIRDMKDGALLINAARGELTDLKAIVEAVKTGKLRGYGTDVLEKEELLFGKKVENIEDEDIKEALELYPRIIITPHIGAHTRNARRRIVQIALEECADFIQKGKAQYECN